MQVGRGLRRNLSAHSFGILLSAQHGGGFESMVRWYGAFLMLAGSLMIPLGLSLLWILATCRYMRDF